MDFSRIQELFRRALEIEPEKWPEFLDTHCGDDRRMREELEALLARHGQLDDQFLEPSPTITEAMRDLVASADEGDSGPDPLIGQRIGAYHIKTRLAVGGMASVYEAVQERPRRVVALKVMRHNIASASALRRFEFEAQVLARMRHPHIAEIYEAGTARIAGVTVPYFAMEYIVGARTLTDYAQSRSLTIRERLELFAKVCDAVHHGHTKGVIHRDLKPANILIDSRGEPKIIDFGVARATDSDLALTTQQTHVGQLVGTMQYMSPEQCDADPHDIDTRSDVYALGVVLYELLTGKLPYDAGSHTIYQVTQIIKEKPPERISRVDPRLRGDIETIVHKALAKDRERRYASAAELAADIRRHLAGEPIAARKPSFWYVASRFAQRHRVAVAGVAAVFLVLVAAVIVAGSLAAWARREAARADQNRRAALAAVQQARQAGQRASRAARQAEIQAALARLGLAQARLKDHDPGAARIALEKVPEHLRGWAWQHLYNVRLDQSLEALRIHNGSVAFPHLRLSADGRWLAWLFAYLADAPRWRCQVYEVLSNPQDDALRVAVQVGGVRGGSIALGPHGRWLMTEITEGPVGGGLTLWDLKAQPPQRCVGVWRFPKEWAVTDLAFLPPREVRADAESQTALLVAVAEGTTGRVVVARLSDLIVQARSGPIPRTPAPESLTDAPQLPVFARLTGLTRDALLFVSPGGRWLAGVSREHIAAVWDIDRVRRGPPGATLEAAALCIGHRDHVLGAAFSPDETCLATCSVDETIRLWDLRPLYQAGASDEEPLRLPCIGVLSGHAGPVHEVSFSPDGQRLYSVGSDRTLRVWQVHHAAPVTDIRTRLSAETTDYRLLRTLYGHESRVMSVVALRNGLIATAANDGTLRLWLPTRDVLPHTAGHYSSTNDARWTADERFLITLDAHDAVCVWDAESLAPLARDFMGRWGTPHALVTWAAESGSAHWVAVASGSLYHSTDLRPRAGVLLYRLTADGRLRRVAVFEPADPGASGAFTSLAVSSDRHRIVAGTSQGELHVWDLRLDGQRGQLTDHRTWPVRPGLGIEALTFLDEHGRWLLSAAGLGGRTQGSPALRLWDLREGRCVARYNAHEKRIMALALSPDRRRLASASVDRTIRLWRVQWDGDQPRLMPDGRPLNHPDSVASVAFHPRQPDLLFSGTESSQIFVWDLQTRAQVANLMIPLGIARNMAFCPDGDHLVVSSSGDQGAGNTAWIFEARRPSRAQLWARARTTRARELIDQMFWNPGLRSIEQYRQRLRTLAETAADPLTRQAAAAALEHIENWLPHPQWYRLRYAHVLKDLVPVDAARLRQAIDWARIAATLWPEEHRPDLDTLRRRLAAMAQAPAVERP